MLRFERTDQAPDTQPQLLREALQQLQSVQLSSPQLELQLMGLTVTPAMTAELHTLAASGWGKVSLHTPEWPQNGPAPTVPLPPLHTLQLKDKLTDTLLVQLQQRLTSVQVLQVAGVALASALPAGARLPWRVIRVTGQCNLTTWPEQAELVGDGVEWELNTLGVSLTPDQVRKHTLLYVNSRERLYVAQHTCCFRSFYQLGYCLFRPCSCACSSQCCTRSVSTHCLLVCKRVCLCVFSFLVSFVCMDVCLHRWRLVRTCPQGSPRHV